MMQKSPLAKFMVPKSDANPLALTVLQTGSDSSTISPPLFGSLANVSDLDAWSLSEHGQPSCPPRPSPSVQGDEELFAELFGPNKRKTGGPQIKGKQDRKKRKTTETKEPGASKTMQPEVSETTQPQAKPKARGKAKAKASQTKKPEASETTQPAASETMQPEASTTMQPEASEMKKAEALQKTPQLCVTPMCCKCHRELDTYRAQITGKCRGSWKCNVCNTRYSQLQRLPMWKELSHAMQPRVDRS